LPPTGFPAFALATVVKDRGCTRLQWRNRSSGCSACRHEHVAQRPGARRSGRGESAHNGLCITATSRRRPNSDGLSNTSLGPSR